MSDSEKTPWMAGLFAGIFSSSDGTWVPMGQLRRFSSVGAWAVFFVSSGYGMFRLAERSVGWGKLDITTVGCVWLFVVLVAVASFWVFLEIGSREFGVEGVDKKKPKAKKP